MVDPALLPYSASANYFDDEEARNDDRVIAAAETYLISRYEETADTPLSFDLGNRESRVVHLDGWTTGEDGRPDTTEMPDELVHRLRLVVADLTRHFRQHEDQKGIERLRQGEREVYFRDLPRVPTRLFAPLRPFDQRTPV
jgi:hypothetical protein